MGRPGPTRSGSISATVRRLASRYLSRRHDPHVQTERHVVDEDLAVDLAQVDGGFTGRPERVECSDRIITVDSEVEGEMVARTGRDAHEWQSIRGRHRGHHRLGAVAAGHAQRIRAPGDRGLGQRPQVVARVEENGLDAPATGLVREMQSPRPSRHPTSGS